MKVREMVKRIEADGWRMLPRKGTSHRQYVHPTKTGRVTVNGEPGDDLTKFMENSVLRQAGLK